jgi:hypothetical protein
MANTYVIVVPFSFSVNTLGFPFRFKSKRNIKDMFHNVLTPLKRFVFFHVHPWLPPIVS